jgi:hypothetical protein
MIVLKLLTLVFLLSAPTTVFGLTQMELMQCTIIFGKIKKLNDQLLNPVSGRPPLTPAIAIKNGSDILQDLEDDLTRLSQMPFPEGSSHFANAKQNLIGLRDYVGKLKNDFQNLLQNSNLKPGEVAAKLGEIQGNLGEVYAARYLISANMGFDDFSVTFGNFSAKRFGDGKIENIYGPTFQNYYKSTAELLNSKNVKQKGLAGDLDVVFNNGKAWGEVKIPPAATPISTNNQAIIEDALRQSIKYRTLRGRAQISLNFICPTGIDDDAALIMLKGDPNIFERVNRIQTKSGYEAVYDLKRMLLLTLDQNGVLVRQPLPAQSF